MFSDRSGLRKEQLRGQASRGNLPSYPLGKHRLVNIAKLGEQSFSQAGFVYVPAPYMTAGTFHECSGIPENSIYEYLATGLLPLTSVGRLRLVDVKALFTICLAFEE